MHELEKAVGKGAYDVEFKALEVALKLLLNHKDQGITLGKLIRSVSHKIKCDANRDICLQYEAVAAAILGKRHNILLEQVPTWIKKGVRSNPERRFRQYTLDPGIKEILEGWLGDRKPKARGHETGVMI
jgi:hypothetical protein